MDQWLSFALPMQGVQVRSLDGELRFQMPHGGAKKKKKKERERGSEITKKRQENIAEWLRAQALQPDYGFVI